MIRSWVNGDVIVGFGGGSQKLSDVFVNQKIEPWAKDYVADDVFGGDFVCGGSEAFQFVSGGRNGWLLLAFALAAQISNNFRSIIIPLFYNESRYSFGWHGESSQTAHPNPAQIVDTFGGKTDFGSYHGSTCRGRCDRICICDWVSGGSHRAVYR